MTRHAAVSYREGSEFGYVLAADTISTHKVWQPYPFPFSSFGRHQYSRTNENDKTVRGDNIIGFTSGHFFTDRYDRISLRVRGLDELLAEDSPLNNHIDFGLTVAKVSEGNVSLYNISGRRGGPTQINELEENDGTSQQTTKWYKPEFQLGNIRKLKKGYWHDVCDPLSKEEAIKQASRMIHFSAVRTKSIYPEGPIYLYTASSQGISEKIEIQPEQVNPKL